MRIRQTMTVSLPPEMIKTVEVVRKAEHRTRSELIREALRTYFSRLPAAAASPAEKRAIQRGRTELERGEFISFDQLLHALGSRPRSVGRKAA